ASDRLNWAWPALQAVLQGREPIEQYTVEQRQPSPGLVELWIHNVGEQNRPNWVRFLITPPSQPIVAYDMFNEYRFGSIPNQLIGPAPYLEKPLLAAWYRIASGSEPIPDLSVSSVEIVP
ncbi:MAG: hypothetical protein RBU29_17615, partial [bacterium]|nr:hypothetical protein [bacterium]